LDRGLDEDVHAALERDQVACVRERLVRVALDETPNEPVGEVGDTEQSYLPKRVDPAVREDARLQLANAGDHRDQA
jgi:hypothetical protein